MRMEFSFGGKIASLNSERQPKTSQLSISKPEAICFSSISCQWKRHCVQTKAILMIGLSGNQQIAHTEFAESSRADENAWTHPRSCRWPTERGSKLAAM